MGDQKRIGIYGGTFDPVHLGHLEVARRVSQLFALDKFLFVPARQAPHKVDREVLAGWHRYTMLALATQNDAHLYVSAFELGRSGRQYTIDTLRHFRAELGDAGKLFFVMGADSWAEISSWRESERLATLADLIVVTRPGYKVDKLDCGEVVESIIDVRGQVEVNSLPAEPGQRSMFITDAVMLDISASDVRQAAAANGSDRLEKLVSPEVAEYIIKYGLYRNR